MSEVWWCRLQLVRRIGTLGSVVAVHWHARLNQIFMGTGWHPPPAVPPPQCALHLIATPLPSPDMALCRKPGVLVYRISRVSCVVPQCPLDLAATDPKPERVLHSCHAGNLTA